MKKVFLSTAFATAAAASLLVSAPAKAACVGSATGNNCTTFNPSSPSAVIYSAYVDAGFVANDRLTDISFYATNVTLGLPVTLTNIAYSLDGTNFVSTGLSATSYTITANGLPGSGTNLLTAFNLPGAIGSNFKLQYTIPTIAGFAPTDGSATIAAYVRNQQSTGPALPQTQTRDSAAFVAPTSSSVPTPLPLIGAGAAFGFSRKLRSRISLTA